MNRYKNYTNTTYRAVKVDFRDVLGAKPHPFDIELTRFMQKAVDIAINKYGMEEWEDVEDEINAEWFDMMGILDLLEVKDAAHKDELPQLTGLSMTEVNFLLAIAAAETIGISITDLEKSAAHYKIHGPNFPGREQGGSNYPYRGDLDGYSRN